MENIHLEVVTQSSSIKKVFLKILQNLYEETCSIVWRCHVADWRPQTLLKGGFQQRCYHMNFAKLPKTPILWNTFERLLLYSQTNINLEHVCLCPLIWFVLIYLIWLALKYKSKRNTFDSFTNSKKIIFDF